MSNIAIEFNHVSKMYQLGVVGTGTLSRDINRWWQTSVLGKPDPYLMIGQTNDRTSKGSSDFVYALKDIDFKVEQGDVVGIIGKNGAGKSTLLKLLSRITAPTTGSIRARGRIASLLEVGTGFHSELTGRENIYLNGSIMGMTKQEIDRKLDEIVDFAGVARYLDTPVKRYSSGMTVRLGFAVAAFLEPEILVVDEVLAVGDAEFQKKAIGKMQDVATNGGRTVLFVSHNMASVRSLCNNGVVLKNGMVEMVGTADECVDFYIGTNITDFVGHTSITDAYRTDPVPKDFEYLETWFLNDPLAVSTMEPLKFRMRFRRNNKSFTRCQFGIIIANSADVRSAVCYTKPIDLPKDKDEFMVEVELPHHNLSKGFYSVEFNICQCDYAAGRKEYDIVRNVLSFEVKYQDAAHEKPFLNWPTALGNNCVMGETVRLI